MPVVSQKVFHVLTDSHHLTPIHSRLLVNYLLQECRERMIHWKSIPSLLVLIINFSSLTFLFTFPSQLPPFLPLPVSFPITHERCLILLMSSTKILRSLFRKNSRRWRRTFLVAAHLKQFGTRPTSAFIQSDYEFIAELFKRSPGIIGHISHLSPFWREGEVGDERLRGWLALVEPIPLETLFGIVSFLIGHDIFMLLLPSDP